MCTYINAAFLAFENHSEALQANLKVSYHSKNISPQKIKMKPILLLAVAIAVTITAFLVSSVSAAETWRKADLTNYESYPDPGSEECIKYNGCTWAGQFAFISGKKPESWVKANNIISIHSKDSKKYKLKTLRLRQGSKTIDAKVYDECSDKDCDGCCTKNAKKTGFLIDVEKYTMKRFGTGSGIVEWTCLDC